MYNNQNLTALSIESPKNRFLQTKKSFMLAGFFSTIWLYFIWDYLFTSGWWAGRANLAPAEFVGNICGLFLPIIIAFIVASFFDRQQQLAYEAQTVRSYLKELIYPSDEGAVYTHSLTEALKKQLSDFKQVFFDVNAQTAEMSRQMKSWLEDIHIQSQQLDYKTQSCVDYITQSVNNLTGVVSQSFEQGFNLASALDTQTKTLSVITDKTSTVLTQMDNLPLHSLNQTIDGIQNKITELELLIEKCQEFSKAQQAFATSTLENTDYILQRQTESLLQIDDIVQSHTKMIGLSDSMTQEYQQNLNDLVANTKDKVDNLKSLFIDQIKNVVGMTDSALSRINSMQVSFNDTTNQLDIITSKLIEAEDKNNTILSSLNETITQPIEFSYVPAIVDNQEIVEPIENNTIQHTVDLLSDAKDILDELQKLSVDMAFIFNPKSEDALWKKYYNGDKTVFMRHVRKTMEDKNKNILKLYQNDLDFATSVNQYMKTFEEIMKKTGQNDDNKIVISLLIGSDVGRLYMVLADVLNKD